MGVYAGPANEFSNRTDSNRIDATTKLVVQSGLVLNLDSGASTSYPGSGTTWTNLIGGGNNGTLTNGPTYSSANGGSIVFDGTNDYVQLASQSLSSVDFSVEVWFYATKAVSSNQILYTSYNLPGGAQGNTLVFLIGAGKVNADNGFGTGVTGTTTISTNTWYHAVATYTASTSTIRSYVNGILQGSAVSPITSGASSNFIGGSPGDNNLGTAWFGGSIPVVRAYRNKVLSAAEISQNFNALRARFGI